MSRNAISRIHHSPSNDSRARKTTFFASEQPRMPSESSHPQSRNRTALITGFVLVAALSGCETNEGQKTHHHHHAQGHAALTANSTSPENQADASNNPRRDVTSLSDTAENGPAPKADFEKTLTIGPAKADESKTQSKVSMPAGGTLTIELPFQAGTGYSWALSSISSDLKMMSQTTRSISEDGRSGGPMLAVYVLECLSADSAQTARFELSRPWETDIPPVRDMILLVNGASTDAND